MGKRKIDDDDEVVAYIADQETPPSVREIAEHFGVRHGGAALVLDRLEAAGKVKRRTGVARGLTVTKTGKAAARAIVAKQQHVETT